MGWRHKLAILPLAVLISFIGAGLISPNEASAATLQNAVSCAGSFRFVDLITIECDTGSGIARFIDTNPGDTITNYQETTGIFCHPNASTGSINIQTGGSLNASDAGSTINGIPAIGYTVQATGQCELYRVNNSFPSVNVGNTANLRILLQFGGGGSTVVSLPGILNSDISGRSYSLDSTYGGGWVYTSGFSAGNCSGDIVILNSGANNPTANRYRLNGSNSSNLPANLRDYLLAKNTPGCGVEATNFEQGRDAFVIRGQPAARPTPPACDPRTGPPSAGCVCEPPSGPPFTNCAPPSGGPGGGTTPDPSCESSWRDGLEWLFCTALRSTDRFLAWLVGIIERQLFFDTDKFLSEEVYRSWSVFRNIAASLLVIIMLLIIISQALSWGPFDAYTVRRVLPRLVAAAILIPLSWPILYFVIGLFNDIGQGIASLMFFPFGGEQNMTLSALLGIDINDPSVNQEVFLGLTVAGGLLAVAIAPFAALGLAWLIVPVIVIGFLVLALREILIVMAVILAPIAIVLWILPGTRKFWNLWQETLEKLLLMFPLIMGLIATGRIFASIAGNNQTSGLDIIAFLLIVVGVFGPLLMIPKTFQWGGQILNNMTGAINNRSKGVFDRPRGFLQGRQKMQNEFRDTKNAQRSAGRRPYTRGPVGWVQRGVVAAKSGRLDPTLRAAGGQQAVDRKGAEFLAKVPRAMNEAVESQKLRLRLELDGLDRPQILERLREYSTDAGSSDEMVRASADMMREQKDKQGLQHMQRELAGQGRGDLWNSIKNANFGDFRQISPDLVEDYTATGGTRARVQTRSGTADMPITFAPLQDKLNALASVAPGTAAHQRMTDDLLAGFRRMDDSQRAGMSADAWHEALTIARASGSTEVHDSLQRIQVNENLTLPAEVRTYVDSGRALPGGTPVESHAPFDANRPYHNPRDDGAGRANPRTPADYV